MKERCSQCFNPGSDHCYIIIMTQKGGRCWEIFGFAKRENGGISSNYSTLLSVMFVDCFFLVVLIVIYNIIITKISHSRSDVVWISEEMILIRQFFLNAPVSSCAMLTTNSIIIMRRFNYE